MTLVPPTCSRCDGVGYLAAERIPGRHAYQARPCPACHTEGVIVRDRRYLSARRCVCGRPFSPPAEAKGDELEHCLWCRRDGWPCRRCGAPVRPARTGRPPFYCLAHSKRRRQYLRQRRARLAATLRPAARAFGVGSVAAEGPQPGERPGGAMAASGS